MQEIFEKRWPCKYAMDWDNVGLLVGDANQEVHHIFVALDVTDETLEQAVQAGADLIVTHHPLIFTGMKKVTGDNIIGRRVLKMIQNKMAYYAMHTNFDMCQMGELNAKALRLENTEGLWDVVEEEPEKGIGKVGTLPQEITLEEFANDTKEALKIPDVRVYGNLKTKVRIAAISGGSGKGAVRPALEKKAQVLVTGDIDYHTAIDAVAQGLCLIDAGHYGTEYIFIEYIYQMLIDLLPEVKVTKAKIEQPFSVVS